MKDGLENKHRIITACTGSGHAEPGRGGSACIVETADTAILLDCGEGIAGWINYYTLAEKFSAIFISHLHPDHVAGLFSVVQNMYMANRIEPLDIYLPVEGIEPIRNMLSAMYLGPEVKKKIFTCRFFSLTSGSVWQNQEMTVHAWPSDHFTKDNITGNTPRPAFGFTIESGLKRLVYTADVATIQCFTSEILPGTTLISEATHIDYRAVVRLAFDRQVNRLIFTHIDPSVHDELNEFCRTCHFVTIARDGLVTEW
ncbi:MAG TPA: MBL fold metallo-hydrolase [bacterium]|nr:MBL fold metallo-hydrolase [bacterium]HPN45987.1 MBL fold metallo-hydrolase [bacterium]